MSGRRITPQAATAEELAADRAELARDVDTAMAANETVEGGKYRTSDGRWINAKGEEISSDGTVKKSG